MNGKEFEERASGLVVPVTKPDPSKVRQDFVQRYLIARQLSEYFARLEDEGAFIEAMWRSDSGPFGRFCVAYSHFERLETEVYT